MVGHTAIVNRLKWMQGSLPADGVRRGGTENAVQLLSVWEFWWPFIAGAEAGDGRADAHHDPQAMQQFFAHYGVTTTHFARRRCWRRLSPR